jgi:hypothetical protein
MSVKLIKEKLEKLIDQIEDEVSKREEYYSDKSDKWQESDSGQAHEEITEALRNCGESLFDGYGNIEDY